MTKTGFVIVSNRLPISVSKIDGELIYTPSSGGLATAMSSLDIDTAKRLWVGWPGIASDELSAADKKDITKKLKEYGCHPVFLSKEQIELFYDGFANDTLWPLFHYFQQYAVYDDAYWNAYKNVNNTFSDAVEEIADSSATIWIHDYHFMLLPALLRRRMPKSTIGFFLHIPFPSYEIFRLLPERREILEGLLGADLLGFHIYDYARHFMSSALRLLGIENNHGEMVHEGRIVRADVFPIGIDYKKFVSALENNATHRAQRKLKQHYNGQHMILSVDRLDYSKGILKRLEAYERFLGEHPKRRKKVCLMVLAVPSRVEVETYKDLRDEIEKMIARINGLYGTVDWAPIAYQFKNMPYEELLALYAFADVALVTPLRDGMNLVAKEYVACKQRNSGVLILSEMAGAIDELPEAIRINPNDTASIADAIEKALSMPEDERQSRLAYMQRRLSNYTVQRWAADFMEELEKTKNSTLNKNTKRIEAATTKRIVARYKSAVSRLILLDYDGTLRKFVHGHEAHKAAPTNAVMQILKRLTSDPNTHIAIVSGRSRDALESWFGDLPVTLAAEHGAWMKHQEVWSQQQISFSEYKQQILPIMYRYAERTPGASVEEKDFAAVWHYRMVPTELAFARGASLKHDLSQLLAGSEIGIYDGAKIIEVKPKSIHKGTVAEDIAALFPSDFVLCIGDDYTDEDMFAVLPEEAFTVKVGHTETVARHQLPSVEAVHNLLDKLAQ
jgi:trehalose 6-phosphate synthase/phosphatase